MLLEIDLTTFYSRGDERRLFQGLSDIVAIKNIRGEGTGLILQIGVRELNRDALFELIALLHRYDMSLAPLSIFAANKRFAWLKDERFYWHKNMFGDASRRAPIGDKRGKLNNREMVEPG